MKNFIPGLTLSKLFFNDAVKPILNQHYPRLKYTAGLIDYGSEVLGYDTPTSMDHHWGPRVLLFLNESRKNDFKRISATLANELPYMFQGYPTNFSAPDMNDSGVQKLVKITKGPVNHRVELHTPDSFFKHYLGLPIPSKITIHQWLAFPSQKLRTIRHGEIFTDGIGINKIRRKLGYYPKDVWYYLLASQWTKISQEEAFIGRCNSVNDFIGVRILSSRIIFEVIKLCFLYEKEYAPYNKWLTHAFAELETYKPLNKPISSILAADNYRRIETNLKKVYTIISNLHDNSKITKALGLKATHYWGRPYYVIHADQVANEIQKKIKKDSPLREYPLIGSSNQFIDSADILENNNLLKKLNSIW